MDTDFRISINEHYGKLRKETEKNVDQVTVGFDGFDMTQSLGEEYFEKYFSNAVKLAEEREVSLYCGEYGVINLAEPDETLKWYKMISHVFDKYKTDWSNPENRNTEKLGNMSYEEWKNNHKERLEKKKTKTKEITSNKAKESLSYIENRDSKLSYEKGAIIGANGDILKEYDGTKHAVEVTDEDLQLMQGITFTHNHPNGGFFSDNDIKTGFIKTHLGELRASTPQGIVYVLKDNNATLEDAQKYLAEYSQTSMRARRTAQEHFIRMIKSGDLSKDYYDKHYFELLQQYRDEKLIAMTKEKAKDFNLIFEVQKIEK
jgi:hypothetical protein